jgi:hypothetical protein
MHARFIRGLSGLEASKSITWPASEGSSTAMLVIGRPTRPSLRACCLIAVAEIIISVLAHTMARVRLLSLTTLPNDFGRFACCISRRATFAEVKAYSAHAARASKIDDFGTSWLVLRTGRLN